MNFTCGNEYTRINVYDVCGLPIRGSDGTNVPRPDRTHRYLNRSFVVIRDYYGQEKSFVFITKDIAVNKYGYDDIIYMVDEEECVIDWCKNKQFKDIDMVGKSVRVFRRDNKKNPYIYMGATPIITNENCTATHVRLFLPELTAAMGLILLNI